MQDSPPPAGTRASTRGEAATAEPLATRLGLGTPDERDDALAWRCLFALLALYLASFALFYPNAATNVDESHYVHQATVLSQGKASIVQLDPFSLRPVRNQPSNYAPGVAALMAPFVRGFGWRGAYVVPAAALLLAVLVTGACLRHEGRSPFFALVVLGFAPSLVMGRVAMSDVPSAALVALGLFCFFRGLPAPGAAAPTRGAAGWWFASGLLAGVSLTFRASNPLLFAPLFAGTLLRREWRAWALVLGGLAGLGFRALAMGWYMGDPLFERSHYAFSPTTVHQRLPLYLFGLLVLVPGGLALALAYRGRRRPEILVTLALFLAFYLFQGFSTQNTGLAKRLVLALRYMIPLLPLLALACAESGPRLWQRWLARRPAEQRARPQRLAGAAVATALLGIATAAAAVHPAFHAWSASQARIRDAVQEHVPREAVLVSNLNATSKFLQELNRRYLLVDSRRLEFTGLRLLGERHESFYVVLLDRSDSAFWRRAAAKNAAFLEEVRMEQELVLDLEASPTDRLRIWKVGLEGDAAGSQRRRGYQLR